MKIVVFGTGILADLALYYFENDSEHEVVGFTLDRNYISEASHKGRPLVSFEEVHELFPPDQFGMFIAVGYANVNRVREEKCKAAEDRGYCLVSYVSSSATILGDGVGSNCFIQENAVIQPFASLGNGVIVWAGSVISHHSRVNDFCYLSPNVTVCGEVRVGKRAFVGAGSVLRDTITVAEDTVIGMGSVVTEDLDNPGVYIGSPAKIYKSSTRDINI